MLLKFLKTLATWKYGAQVGEVCGFILELVNVLRYQMTVIKTGQDPRLVKIGTFLYEKFGMWNKNSSEKDTQFVSVLGYYFVRSVLDLLNPGSTVDPEAVIAQIASIKANSKG